MCTRFLLMFWECNLNAATMGWIMAMFQVIWKRPNEIKPHAPALMELIGQKKIWLCEKMSIIQWNDSSWGDRTCPKWALAPATPLTTFISSWPNQALHCSCELVSYMWQVTPLSLWGTGLGFQDTKLGPSLFIHLIPLYCFSLSNFDIWRLWRS